MSQLAQVQASAAQAANQAQQRPTTTPAILRGEDTPVSRSEATLAQVIQQRDGHRQDVAPILVGQGDQSRVALMSIARCKTLWPRPLPRLCLAAGQ